jgi:EAL domain-containing protein (putative c-di-GMP-specific phosphodiesterase class I)
MTEDTFEDGAEFSGPSGPAVVPKAAIETFNPKWLEIWYQPKIDLKRKCLAGAEALLRINHPQSGLLWPDDYLDLLDEGELAELTEQALVAVLGQWSVFAESGFDLRLAVNIPAPMLTRLPIKALVTKHRPQSTNWPGLILEIGEDQIVRNIASTREIASELTTVGVAIAIDDFGAGYSSFSGLRDLSFSELKLHGSFVKNCAVDVTNAAICQTAIDFAHRFGSMAVAKDINSIADLQALVVMGCDFGQGLLVAPPMSKEQFLDALRQHADGSRSPQPRPGDGAEKVA